MVVLAVRVPAFVVCPISTVLGAGADTEGVVFCTRVAVLSQIDEVVVEGMIIKLFASLVERERSVFFDNHFVVFEFWQ